MKLGTVIQVSLLLLLLLTAAAAQQRRPRKGQRPRPVLRRVPGRKPGSTRFLRGGGPPRRRPGKGFKPPPPPAAPPVPGPDLVVPASGAPSEALRAGLDGVRNFQHLLSDTPPAPGPTSSTTPAPRPHSTTRPPLSREQVAMLQELQSILGGKPLPIDTTTERSRRRPDAKRELPLFPPFGNAGVDERVEGEELPGEGVVSGALFQDFSPSRLFSPPAPSSGGQRRQFVRFPDEPNDVASGVVDAGNVRFPRPVTVAPSIVTARPTTSSSLRILGGLRPLLGADAENGERGARVIQSVDDDGQLVTSVFSSSTRATLDRAVTPPSLRAVGTDFGFGRPPLSVKPKQRRPGPGPALATGLRLHQVLTSTSRPTPQPAAKATTYNPQGLRNSFLSALNDNSASQQDVSSSGAVRDLGRDPLPLGGELNALARDRFGARPAGSRGAEKADVEDIVRRSVMPQDPEKLCQSTAENGFCDTDEQYPKPYMERVVDQCSTILEYLFSEVPDDLSQLTASDRNPSASSGGPVSRGTGREWSWAAYNYQHQDVCDSTAHFVEPSYARATDGRWYVIVQHRSLRQRVSVGMCTHLEGFCRAVSDCGKKSRCVQTFYHRTLIAADPQLPTKCPRMRTFRLPGGCQCQVELAKSLRTLGQTGDGS